MGKSLIIKIKASDLLWLTLLGIFGIVIYNICFFKGLNLIPASSASLIVAMNPAVIALLSFLFLKESLNGYKILGILCCILGCYIVISSKDPSAVHMNNHFIGELWIFGGVLSWGIYTVFSKKVVPVIGSIHAVYYSAIIGTIILLLLNLSNPTQIQSDLAILDHQSLSMLLFLGSIGSALAYIATCKLRATFL